jgi:hypothetical protein
MDLPGKKEGSSMVLKYGVFTALAKRRLSTGCKTREQGTFKFCVLAECGLGDGARAPSLRPAYYGTGCWVLKPNSV